MEHSSFWCISGLEFLSMLSWKAFVMSRATFRGLKCLYSWQIYNTTRKIGILENEDLNFSQNRTRNFDMFPEFRFIILYPQFLIELSSILVGNDDSISTHLLFEP